LLSAFFLRYLAVERGLSPHTSTSYRDAIKLLLQFTAARYRRSVDQLVIEDLTAPVVLDFLADLETSLLVAAGEGAIMAERSGPGREWRVAASGPAGAPGIYRRGEAFVMSFLRHRQIYQSDLVLD